MNATEMITREHDKLQSLLQEFNRPGANNEEKRQTALETIQQMDMHAKIMQEVFLPAVRKKAGDLTDGIDRDTRGLDEIDRLVGDLMSMPADLQDQRFASKFATLREDVRNHITEEDSILSRAGQELGDEGERLADQMAKRKQQISEQVVGRGRDPYQPS